MKVCIVAEGCYPYVVGGVSGWINSMIKSFPNIEFILLTIVANRSVRGKFVYELPENLTQVYELYLEDCEYDFRYENQPNSTKEADGGLRVGRRRERAKSTKAFPSLEEGTHRADESGYEPENRMGCDL